jgi:uncharacterized membrane protein
MANITYRITLIDEGLDSGPNYEVYTSVDCIDYTFIENITLEDIADFVDVSVDESVNCIRLYNNNAVCTNFRTIVVGTAPTTTTTTSAPTTTTTAGPTTTTTSTTTSTTTTTTVAPQPEEQCIFWNVDNAQTITIVRTIDCGTGVVRETTIYNTFLYPGQASRYSGCFREKPVIIAGGLAQITSSGICFRPIPPEGTTTTTTAGPTTTTTTTIAPVPCPRWRLSWGVFPSTIIGIGITNCTTGQGETVYDSIGIRINGGQIQSLEPIVCSRTRPNVSSQITVTQIGFC